MNIRGIPFLAPAAFTMVMGTGALALATLEMAQKVHWLIWFAQFVGIANYIIFFILAVWSCISWPSNMPTLVLNFEQPDNCALYSAVGIALLVLGAQILRFGINDFLACLVWCLGALVTLLFNYGILLRFFLHPGIEMSHITPVLFVPVASMVVMPVGGAPISLILGGIAKNIVILASILALGGGLALYIGLFSIMLQRHLMLKPLPCQLSPTLWIHLAPIGWAGVAIISLGQYALPPQFWAATQFIALILFGAALWWLFMAAILCLWAVKKHDLGFSMAWWSFIFPIGSVTILSNHLEFEPARMMFPFLWCMLAGLWLFCLIRTIGILRRR